MGRSHRARSRGRPDHRGDRGLIRRWRWTRRCSLPHRGDTDEARTPPTAPTAGPTGSPTTGTATPPPTPATPADASGWNGAGTAARRPALVDRLVSSLRGRSLGRSPTPTRTSPPPATSTPTTRSFATSCHGPPRSAPGSASRSGVTSPGPWTDCCPPDAEAAVQWLYSASATGERRRNHRRPTGHHRGLALHPDGAPRVRRRAAASSATTPGCRRCCPSGPTPRRSCPPSASSPRPSSCSESAPGTARSVLVAAPRTYDPTRGSGGLPRARRRPPFPGSTPWPSMPWSETTGRTKARAGAAGEDAAIGRPGVDLSEFRPQLADGQREEVDAVATVVEDGVAFEQTYGELLDELTSTRWRYHPGAWASCTTRSAPTSATRRQRSASCPIASTSSPRTERCVITVENGLTTP